MSSCRRRSHFEYPDLYPAYGQHFLQRAEPVIPPVGESLPNTEIFRRLAKRFGFTDPAFQATDADLMDEALAQDDPRLRGVKPSTLPLDAALVDAVQRQRCDAVQDHLPEDSER